MRTVYWTMIAICTLGLAIVIQHGGALAHGEYDWIRLGNYHSPVRGIHCCGENDCVKVRGSDVEVREGGYFIKSTGEFIENRWVKPFEDFNYWRCHHPTPDKLNCFFAPASGG